MFPTIHSLICAVLLLSEGIVAPGPGEILVGPPTMRRSMAISDHFDEDYQFPKGTMDACLDDIMHAAEKTQLFIDASDSVIMERVPDSCMDIATEVALQPALAARDGEYVPVAVVGEKSIRMDTFPKHIIKAFREAAEGHDTFADSQELFEVHLV